MECGFLLDVVIGKGAAVLKLLSSEDKTLLVWRNSRADSSVRWTANDAVPLGDSPLLVLNLGLDGLNAVRGLDLEGNGLSREGLDENLHGYLR